MPSRNISEWSCELLLLPRSSATTTRAELLKCFSFDVGLLVPQPCFTMIRLNAKQPTASWNILTHMYRDMLFIVLYRPGINPFTVDALEGSDIELIVLTQVEPEVIQPGTVFQKKMQSLAYSFISCQHERATIMRMIRHSTRSHGTICKD